MDEHPILGKNVKLGPDRPLGRVYTRTVVLWAVGITIDPQQLWENVEVRSVADDRIVRREEDIGATVCLGRTAAREMGRTRRPAQPSDSCIGRLTPVVAGPWYGS